MTSIFISQLVRPNALLNPIDSVYDSSQSTIERGPEVFEPYQDSGVPEELGYMHSISKDSRKKFIKEDSYGFNKLEAEAYLTKFAA